jgi:hypothetical protein
MTDNHEFCWIGLEKVTPILMAPAAQLPDCLEIRVANVPQFLSFDSRNQCAATTVGFAAYSSTYTCQGNEYASFEFQSSDQGFSKVPFDVLRGKVWNVSVDYLANKGVLQPSSISNSYMIQIGVFI